MNKTISDIFTPIGNALGIKKRAKFYFNSVAMGDKNEKIRIVPVGKYPYHPDGGHEVSVEDIKSMADNLTDSGMDILFDYGHESLWNPKASAAGWSAREGVEAMEDGLYVTFPKLTPKAKLQVEEDEFRYLSPVYRLKGNNGAELISVALTNTPYFTTEIDHLKNSFIQLNGGFTMNKEIREFFDLPESAGENELAVKIGEIKDSKKINSLSDLLPSREEIAEDERFVNTAIESGKITPAEREMWKAFFISNPEEAKRRMESLKVNAALPGKINLTENEENGNLLDDAAFFIKSQGR